MQSGSAATRNSADIVLLGDSFTVLPQVFEEGQRIVNSVFDNMRLLLTRTFYVILLIIITGLAGADFFFLPRHDVLVSFISAGLPLMLLTVWARTGQTAEALLLPAMRFVIPAAFSIGLLTSGVYLFYIENESVEVARTVVTLLASICGISLIFIIKPLHQLLAVSDHDPQTSDFRPALTAIAMMVILALVMLLEPLRDFFAMIPLDTRDYIRIAAISMIWFVIFRFVLAAHLFERFLGMQYGHEPVNTLQ